MLLAITDNRSVAEIVEAMFHCPNEECEGEIMVIPLSVGIEDKITFTYAWRCCCPNCKYHKQWQSEPHLVGW